MPRKPPSVTVSERPKGSGKWSVRWRERGSSKELRHPSRESAEAEAVEVRERLREGLPGVRTVRPVGRVVSDWYDRYAATEVATSTLNLYKRASRLILDDPIADEDAYRLPTAEVNAWMTRQLAAGESKHLLRNARTVLSSAFQRAIEWGELTHNPVRGSKSPKVDRRPIEIPTRWELARLGMVVPEPDAKWRSLLLVAALCGLRPQEQFALQWRWVRDDHVLVREAIMPDRRGMKAPKSRRGLREVPMPPVVSEALAEWRKQTPRGGERDLVWSTQIGSAFTHSSYFHRVWKGWRADAGVSLQWRHLRHFYASMLAAANVSLMQASRWMGHSSIRTTDEDYGFLFDADTADAMRRLQDLFR